jgi:hypothetical protein
MTSTVAGVRRLRDLAGIGRSIEANLHRLEIRSVAELAAADGDELYERLGRLEGVRQDPCVLDTFRCAVAQARDPSLRAEQRNWWWWSQQRKAAAGK